jgi:hypothetical protein
LIFLATLDPRLINGVGRFNPERALAAKKTATVVSEKIDGPK